jgi:diaminopimelate epimerase
MKLKFTKMHGAGNDFILIDEFNKILIPEERKSNIAAKISNRHFGIGSDGVIFIRESEKEQIKFSFYNPDGSAAEMCGNGIRCFAKYVYEKGILKNEIKNKKINVETLAGTIIPELTVENGIVKLVKVDMGAPAVEFINKEIKINENSYRITSISMGNPHAVLFYENVDGVDVVKIGREIRNHLTVFPKGTNIHFVEKTDKNEFKIRTYERGVEDETLACGTGICASAVASALNNKVANKFGEILFHAKGGDIKILLEFEERKITKVYLIGNAEYVFEGEIEV